MLFDGGMFSIEQKFTNTTEVLMCTMFATINIELNISVSCSVAAYKHRKNKMFYTVLQCTCK